MLDEPGVTAERGDRAAVCVIEALCWAGRAAVADGASGEDEADALVDRIVTYNQNRRVEKDLVSPWGGASEEEDDTLREEVSWVCQCSAARC